MRMHDDTHKLDMSTNTWKKLTTSGTNKPGKHSGHTTTLYGNHAILFGGWDGSRTNNAFKLNLQTKEWDKIDLSTTSIPSGRSHHSASMYGDELVVFGGLGASSPTYKNDVWALNLITRKWKEITPVSGTPPAGRAGHSGNIYKNDLIVFAGDAHPTRYSDLFKFNMITKGWSEIDASNKPAKRTNARPRGEHLRAPP